MRLDTADFPVVRMHIDAPDGGDSFELFEHVLAWETPFVVLTLGCQADRIGGCQQRERLSNWMRQHREPLHRFIKAMVYVEPHPTHRFIAKANATAFDTLWGYPLLVTGSEAEALKTAVHLFSKGEARDLREDVGLDQALVSMVCAAEPVRSAGIEVLQ